MTIYLLLYCLISYLLFTSTHSLIFVFTYYMPSIYMSTIYIYTHVLASRRVLFRPFSVSARDEALCGHEDTWQLLLWQL